MSKNKAVVSYDGIDSVFVMNNTKDHIQKYLKTTGMFYELDMLEDIKKRVKSRNPLIIDAGAYIGNHTIFFAKICNANVLAFEPYEASYENLLKNIAANNLNERVTVYNYALGDTNKKAKLEVADPLNSGMTKVISAESGDVKVKKLDEVALSGIHRLDVLKIDVEGMEIELLRGALGTIDHFSPLIYVEAFENERLREIIKLLSPLGYYIVDVFNSTPTYLLVRKDKRKIRNFIKKLT